MTEITATMQARTRTVWLTDHPGSTVADFERVKAPSPRTAAARRDHSDYLNWQSSPRTRRLIGLPETPAKVGYTTARVQARWLQEHPGRTAADFERVMRASAAPKEHREFLAWLNGAGVLTHRAPSPGKARP